MGRIIGLAGLLLLSNPAIAGAAMQVQVGGDHLTLRAENDPLHDLLQAIVIAKLFSFRLDACLTTPIAMPDDGQPLLDTLDSPRRAVSI